MLFKNRLLNILPSMLSVKRKESIHWEIDIITNHTIYIMPGKSKKKITLSQENRATITIAVPIQ